MNALSGLLVHRSEEILVGLGVLDLVEEEGHRVDGAHLHEDAPQHPHPGERALIDTGSKMDEVIFEEFKGTGNSEIVLDRKVSDKRIFPSLDVGKSGTRKEELLVDQATLSKMWVLRRILMQMGTVDAMQFLLDKMKDAKSNEDFFASMNQ